MKAFVVAISGFFLATGAFAQDPGEDSAAAGTEAGSSSATDQREVTASENNEANRQICRRMDSPTGSRMNARRICMTAEQWRSFNRSR
jgi:hypothetical protein